MSFLRRHSIKWHEEVPGARWFKGDLHIHTIDDLDGGRAKMPHGISGDPKDPEVLGRYARSFLQGVIAKGIQVIALTPHSPRLGSGHEAGAVWKIIDEWNDGNDDDGVPFREKVYAIFPGFEPSLKNGSQGLHLLFLFDPEIGRGTYMKLFDLVMGSVSPWREKTLQISNKDAKSAFSDLHNFRDRECRPRADGTRPWQYLVLAPHINAPNGLLGAQKAQVLQLFDHGEIAGLELGDEKTPEDTLQNRPWLEDGMTQHRQAFFFASDAYSVDRIGRRCTWFKLASPKVEALRQAFIASDSRIRLGFSRGDDGELREIDDPPDVMVSGRPWLRRVTVRGGASFFGAQEKDDKTGESFELSPDLTCIIGGSMTGKSTLLDGLRVFVGAQLPQNPSLKKQVEDRANSRFLAGFPDVSLTCPGSDPTAPLQEQWPAVFFSQNELQRLAGTNSAIEEILARLVPAETDDIRKRQSRIMELDQELQRLAKSMAAQDQQVVEAEQAHSRAKAARDELAAFSEAGVDSLHQAGRSLQSWNAAVKKAASLGEDLDGMVQSTTDFEVPEIGFELAAVFENSKEEEVVSSLSNTWKTITENLKSTREELGSWISIASKVQKDAETRQRELRATVERNLVALGFDANRLLEFQALNQHASLLTAYAANLEEARNELRSQEKRFASLTGQRDALVEDQRRAFDRVLRQIELDFEGRIRGVRVESGDVSPLEEFLQGLSQRGITRWWNDLGDKTRPTPLDLIEGLEDSSILKQLGMTAPVQKTLLESLTKAKKHALAAVRCPDRYSLELKLEDGSSRPLEQLSGGQRVSVLLSLLLETKDTRPLVIDQPEDELDNRFLFETVLPALKKLKGRRQVIVATHNANIVVNGDADMVIQLEATANHGFVARSGAIEEPVVRDAIVRTVDGGDEAFRLRQAKYGF